MSEPLASMTGHDGKDNATEPFWSTWSVTSRLTFCQIESQKLSRNGWRLTQESKLSAEIEPALMPRVHAKAHRTHCRLPIVFTSYATSPKPCNDCWNVSVLPCAGARYPKLLPRQIHLQPVSLRIQAQ